MNCKKKRVPFSGTLKFFAYRYRDSFLVSVPAISFSVASVTVEISARTIVGAGTSLVYRNGPGEEFGVMQRFNSFVGSIVIGHFNKSKTPGTTSHFVFDNVYRANFSVIREKVNQFVILSLVA
jgi:hypothetical protein